MADEFNSCMMLRRIFMLPYKAKWGIRMAFLLILEMRVHVSTHVVKEKLWSVFQGATAPSLWAYYHVQLKNHGHHVSLWFFVGIYIRCIAYTVKWFRLRLLVNTLVEPLNYHVEIVVWHITDESWITFSYILVQNWSNFIHYSDIHKTIECLWVPANISSEDGSSFGSSTWIRIQVQDDGWLL